MMWSNRPGPILFYKLFSSNLFLKSLIAFIFLFMNNFSVSNVIIFQVVTCFCSDTCLGQGHIYNSNQNSVFNCKENLGFCQ